MKSKILFILLILTSTRIFGQLHVDAGNDMNICYKDLKTDSIVLGGIPTASGGIGPYIYTWSINYYFWGASDLLDDSTKANPIIINCVSGNLKFKLTVKDSIGNQVVDSIFVRISDMKMTMIYYRPVINQGDTIELFHNYFLDGIEPLKYTWYPNYNISDTTVSNPKAWPDITITYQVFATDSIGCISPTTESIVYVNPVGINSMKELNRHSMVFPNPIDNNSEIRFSNPNHNKLTISIFNTNGQKTLGDVFSTNSYFIGNKITKSGMYIYSVSNGSEIVAHGKFIKE